QAPHRGIERREQLVLHEHARMGEAIEQRRLARVRVTDQRNMRDRAPTARLALRFSCCRKAAQIAFELLNAAQQATAINLELRLTGAAGADSRTLLAELQATTAQTR